MTSDEHDQQPPPPSSEDGGFGVPDGDQPTVEPLRRERRSRNYPAVAAVVAVVALIAGVAGGRILLRGHHRTSPDSNNAAAQANQPSRTGSHVPVELAALPSGLGIDGTFTCNELKIGDRYSAIADGATVTNTSKQPLRLAFRFDVYSGSDQQSVSRRFELPAGDKIPSVAMTSKTLAGHVTKCALAFLADAGYDPAKSAAARDAAQAAGCDQPQAHPIEGRSHVDPPATVHYKTTPPTSGDHYPTPGTTGVHDQPIQNETQVHNLEHGHIGVQYQGVDQSTIDALVEGIKGNGQWAFVAPYPNMKQHVALTAWGVSLDCQTAPSDASKLTSLVKAFIAAYSDHAPESIPGSPR